MRLPVTSLLIAALILVSCGDDGRSTAPSTTLTTTPTTHASVPPDTTSIPATTTTAPELVHDLVNVYWAWNIPTASGTPERLAASQREVMTDDPLTEALQIVIGGGPDETEQGLGMSTTFPTGTRLLGLETDDATAIVDLTSEFNQSRGTLGEAFRLAQIVFTVTQFDGLERVRFRVNGIDQDLVGTHGIEVGDGLTRDDFADVRPAILVESPSPVVAVAGSFTIRGEANTFEATVLYRVSDEAGSVLVEGVTTATAGTGTWGSFAVHIDLPTDAAGRVTLQVFESSAVDGAEVNVVTYPLQIDAGTEAG